MQQKKFLLAVFTSDNGSGYRPANLPLRGKKGSVFEVRPPIGSSYSEKVSISLFHLTCEENDIWSLHRLDLLGEGF